MGQSVQKTRKPRSFLQFLSKVTVVSAVIAGGSVSGYYTAQYLDRSESLIAKFASIQVKSKLPVTRKKLSSEPIKRSSFNKTNQYFFAKTDVMHAADSVLVAAQKSGRSGEQQTVAASKAANMTPKPVVLTSVVVPGPSNIIKPYPLPAQTDTQTDPKKIIIEPASLNLGKKNDQGGATISLRASLSETEPQKTTAKIASISSRASSKRSPLSLAPPALAPSSLMTVRKFRARAEKRRLAAEQHCLAQAIYFEARSEPSLGQMAVANVVMNRVRSRHYPNSICGVVFQGQERRHKCQFSFACDGKSDRPRKNKHWRRAEQMAGQVMQGRKRIRALDETLHYHADYVRPRWSRKMDRVKKIGRHIFFHDKSLKEKI